METLAKTSFIYLLSLTIILTNGCVKEEYDPNKITALNHTPELAIPLVYSKMTVEDILNQDDDPTDDLTQDAAGLLSLIYKTSKTITKPLELNTQTHTSDKTSNSPPRRGVYHHARLHRHHGQR